MKIIKYWTIRIDDAALQSPTFALQSKGDCFLSANTKLVGFDKAVQLTTAEIAVSFRNAVLSTLQRRHGDAVRATVMFCSGTSTNTDDVLVLGRITASLFTPNKKTS
jgi:hypothetical protein